MNTYGPTLSLHAALPICGGEPDQPHRRPVRAPIIIAGAIGTARAGEAAGRVREILEPAVVLRVGAAAVGHRIEVDRPRDQIDQRKARARGWQSEIGDAEDRKSTRLNSSH